MWEGRDRSCCANNVSSGRWLTTILFQREKLSESLQNMVSRQSMWLLTDHGFLAVYCYDRVANVIQNQVTNWHIVCEFPG